MKPHWAIFALLALAIPASAQQKPATPSTASTNDAKPVALASSDLKVKILQVQLEQAQLKSTYQQYDAAMKQVQSQFASDTAKLADLEKQAFAEQKLSEADYTLDLSTLTFTPKQKSQTKPSSK